MFSIMLSKLEIVKQTVIMADTSRPSETTANGNIRLQIKKEKKIISENDPYLPRILDIEE